jgi:hypothetical protein
MTKLVTIGRVSRETKSVPIISRSSDGVPVMHFYKCVNKTDPNDFFTAGKPGTLNQSVDLEVYSCTEF